MSRRFRSARWRDAQVRWPRLEAFAPQPESACREIAQLSVALTLTAAT